MGDPDFVEFVQPQDVVSFHEPFGHFADLVASDSAIDIYLTYMLETDQQAAEIPEYAREHGVTSYKLYLQSMSPEAEPHWPGRRAGLGHGFDDGTCYLAMENVAALGPPGVVCMHCENWEIARIFDGRLKDAGPRRLGRLVGPLAALPGGAPRALLRLPGRGHRLPDLRAARDDGRDLPRDRRAAGPRRHLPRPDRPPLAALRQGRAERLAHQRAAARARGQPGDLAGAARRHDRAGRQRPRGLVAAERLRLEPPGEHLEPEDRLHVAGRDAPAGAAGGRAPRRPHPRAAGAGRVRRAGAGLRPRPAQGVHRGRRRRRPRAGRPRPHRPGLERPGADPLGLDRPRRPHHPRLAGGDLPARQADRALGGRRTGPRVPRRLGRPVPAPRARPRARVQRPPPSMGAG